MEELVDFGGGVVGDLVVGKRFGGIDRSESTIRGFGEAI